MAGASHPPLAAPSPWVARFAPLVATAGTVLDYACGSGRHARWFAGRGHPVVAVDRDAAALAALQAVAGVRAVQADLEDGPWPFEQGRYAAVVMTNYLFRPRFEQMCDLVADGGVLIAETFMVGNERLGKPSNPAFLLKPGELLERTAGDFLVVAFEQGEITLPKPAVVQRICAIRGHAAAGLPPLPRDLT
ncbi:MAG: methyltransferase domain-containing protein [Zoogloeaceae bacterium]|nr:methyltransferase domain-containing protein [Rhodocyclaceae bacterium]MCP5235556.1 methyltransferase domain-containing protein [Zoogloeaceae bacterium]